MENIIESYLKSISERLARTEEDINSMREAYSVEVEKVKKSIVVKKEFGGELISFWVKSDCVTVLQNYDGQITNHSTKKNNEVYDKLVEELIEDGIDR